MHAHTERHVLLGIRAVEIEFVGVFEHRRVAIGRHPHQDRPIAVAQLLAVEVGVARDGSRQAERRCVDRRNSSVDFLTRLGSTLNLARKSASLHSRNSTLPVKPLVVSIPPSIISTVYMVI